MSIVLYVAAAVVFFLAAFGANLAGASALELVAFGLGLFALAHAVP